MKQAVALYDFYSEQIRECDEEIERMYAETRPDWGILPALARPSQATVATARMIASVVYRMLKYQIEFDPLSVNEYQQQYEAQQICYMQKRAAKLSYQLVPAPA